MYLATEHLQTLHEMFRVSCRVLDPVSGLIDPFCVCGPLCAMFALSRYAAHETDWTAQPRRTTSRAEPVNHRPSRSTLSDALLCDKVCLGVSVTRLCRGSRHPAAAALDGRPSALTAGVSNAICCRADPAPPWVPVYRGEASSWLRPLWSYCIYGRDVEMLIYDIGETFCFRVSC